MDSTFGGCEAARKAILVDFVRHAFDGSGARQAPAPAGLRAPLPAWRAVKILRCAMPGTGSCPRNPAANPFGGFPATPVSQAPITSSTPAPASTAASPALGTGAACRGQLVAACRGQGVAQRTAKSCCAHCCTGRGDAGFSVQSPRSQILFLPAHGRCSKIEKKPYYHLFKLASFTGFDGEVKS
jgi:hypothetical protein